MPSRPLRSTFILAIALTAVLAGCGRRGALEPPVTTAAPTNQARNDNGKKASTETIPDRHFILDPLIE